MTELDIVKAVSESCNLALAEERGVEVVDAELAIEVVRAARELIAAENEEMAKRPPSSMEIFEVRNSAIKALVIDVFAEIGIIQASPFHQGLSTPLIEIEGCLQQISDATDKISLKLEDLKRASNGHATVEPSGDTAIGAVG